MISLTATISRPDGIFGMDRYPKLCVMLKLLELEGINNITKAARNHSSSFLF